MSSRRKTGDDGICLSEVPPRPLLDLASADPRCAADAGPQSDETVGLCAEWIALSREIEGLVRRWQALETWVGQEYGWFELNEGEQRALPAAAEMYEIDERLELMSRDQERRLALLAGREANTVQSLAGILAVAARIMRDEANPAEPFVVAAMRGLPSACCTNCGERLVARGGD